MKWRQVIRRRIREQSGGTNLAADINAVISANVGERSGSHSHVSSRERIVQRSGEPKAENETDRREGGGK